MNKKQANILWFDEVDRIDIPLVGGKGANLGELTKAKITVPPGFNVTAKAYFDFLTAAGLKTKIQKLLQGLDPENSKRLHQVADDIQKLVLKARMSPKLEKEITKAYQQLYTKYKTGIYVAVRSSATAEDLPEASFAGQQATFLNISGAKEVVRSVQLCWASLFEARAIYYRQINGFNHLKVGIAVPIQSMVQSDKSGILFSIDPVKNNKDVIVIDAGFGLGEAIVSGSITPDRYIVDKKTLKIIDKEINQQSWKITRVKDRSGKEKDKHVTIPKAKQSMQKLTDEEILKLAELGKRIEEHYNFPQDTEWAIEGGKIYFVQSRPVTTIGKKVPITETDAGQIELKNAQVILKGAAASIGSATGPVKIIHNPNQIDLIQKGDVLVTEMTTPDYVPAMKRAVAIITDTGGRTCHAAIVSREMGIPCVVGTSRATSILKNGQVVTVDGANGAVYKGKIAAPHQENQEPISTKDQIKYRQEIPITGTKVYVNLAEVELAQKVADEPVDGVGLLRAEFIIAAMGKHPKAFLEEGKSQEFTDQLAEGLRQFCQAFYPRPVTYRATDFKSNEYKNLKGGEKYEPKEENPMIGYRGCFRYIKDPEVFKMELAAVKKVREQFDLRNLNLMIPFVRTVDELTKVKKIIDQEGLERSGDFKLIMMVEVPSNVILLEDFIKVGIDGVSIGSNDLTQLILGLDRDSQMIAEEFDERNPAVVKSVQQVVKTCRKFNITSSVCGQAPSVYPEFTEMLVEAGITSVSVNPDVIVSTRRLIASIERKLLLKQLMR